VVYHISEEGLDFIRVFSGSAATSSASLLTVAAAEAATAAGRRRRRRRSIIIIMAGAQDSTNNTGVHNEEEKKPLDGGGGAHINLKVKGQDGGEVFFRIKSTATLKKLMHAYCDRQSVDPQSIAFLFDGRRLRAEQTPAELDMEDGDEIDAMLHQTGGMAL